MSPAPARRRKASLLGQAIERLSSVGWVGPYDLVMVEAMACGMAVIAWQRDAVTEVVD
jgi:glycosyltransferase involved in cell wall biosynthesis